MAIACDAASLMANSNCVISCIVHGQASAIKTHLLAKIAGGSQDPSTLLTQAKCFLCLTRTQLLAVRIYLLAVITGTPIASQALIDNACCLMGCLTPGQLGLIQIYILASKAGETPDGSLVAEANCFFCLVGGQNDMIQTYLLATIAGGSTDPYVLMSLASCILQCLTCEQLLAAETALLCDWV